MKEITKGYLLFNAIFFFGVFLVFNPFNFEVFTYINKFGFGWMLMLLSPIAGVCYRKLLLSQISEKVKVSK